MVKMIKNNTSTYIGKSTDEKPENVTIGSCFIEKDTGNVFMYDGEWFEI